MNLSELSKESHEFLLGHGFLVNLQLTEIESIKFAVQIGINNLNRFTEKVSGKANHAEDHSDFMALFICARQVVTGLSAIARILNSTPKRAKKDNETLAEFKNRKLITTGRSACLRELLEVEIDNPLIDVSARHRLVHFDEVIDRLYLDNKGEPFIRSTTASGVYDPSTFGGSALERYDLETSVYSIKDNDIDFADLLPRFFAVTSKAEALTPIIVKKYLI